MEYKAEVNYSTGLISASGSEEFVMRVLDWAKEQKEIFRTPPSDPAVSTVQQSHGDPSQKTEQNAPSGLAKFPDVFDTRGDDVAVIADTKQSSVAATARMTMLLYLLGRKLIGKNETTDDELRSLCEEHACYDSKNFASHIDGLKGKIIQDGSSRKFSAKLTVPGEREAKAIAEKIQNDATSA